MSWHEDFTRNFSRFFSRSKASPLDRNKSEEDDASTVNSSSHTPAQELQFSDLLDRNSESHEQDVTWGGAGGSALELPPLCTPVPHLGPTAPPADGFFRRLGSLFFFSQAEAVEVQTDRQTDTDSSCLMTRDSQTDAEAQKTGGSVEVSVCHSEVTHTQSEEQSEDHCNSLDINSTITLQEEKRRHDLACPPVVTYGTYRGLRVVRKQKKYRCMDLHSPVSEGEESTHPESHEHTHITLTSKTVNYGCQENPTSVDPHICHTSGIESDLTVSGTDTETRDGDPAITLPHIAERDYDFQMSCGRLQGEIEEKLATVDSGKDGTLLRLESVKMVDIILGNAFVALERMEVPDPGSDNLATGELPEDSNLIVLEGAAVGSNAEQQFSVMLSDQTPSLGLEEAQAASRSHVEGCRSTPSSGYESIAGSDTDIRFCVASDITASNVPISSEQKEHDANQTLLQHFAEEREMNRIAACKSGAADEMSSVNLHILSKTNSRSEQPPGNVSAPKTEQDGGRNTSQDTAKDYTMSNRRSLNSDSCYVCTIDTVISVNGESQSRSEPFNHSLAPDKEDSDKKDTPKISESLGLFPSTQSLYLGEHEAPHSGISVDKSVILSADEHVWSGGHDSSQWTSVKAFRCNITDDQSPGTLEEDLESELSLDTPAEGTTSAASSVGKKIQFDSPGHSENCSASVPQHSRLIELDLVRVDGGFDIISEEEEMDSLFVNEMGPMHSPSTRRNKMYPFSLSPIYEEECVREEVSGNGMLQVPPAMEEEQRSVEQPALSVLSLLQSVSLKLQSSIQSASDERHTVCLGSVPRPLWDHYRVDGEEEDEDISSGLQQHQQQTETKTVNEANSGDEFCSHIDRTDGEAEDRLQECDGNVGKSTTTPYYQYLTSSVIPSAERVHKEAKHCSAGCQSESNTTVRGELGGFGKFSPRPSIIFIYEGESLSGERRAIFDDVEDAEKVRVSHGATVHAVKGCWLLYVDSWFCGPCVLLEEGQTVRISEETQQNPKELKVPNRTEITSVGSIRTLLKDDRVAEMHLHVNMPQMSDTLRLFTATDLMEQHGTVFLSDLCVKNGCWLVYDKPGFSGNSAVLEAEGRVTPIFHNSPVTRVKSLRPLIRGGLKVMRPLDPKVILYEKQQFQGQHKELLDHTSSLMTTDGPLSISSIRVLGGTWVCFSEEGFRGHQCVLEEGQYSNCTQLFSHTEYTIKSLRYIQSDFWEPSVCLKRSDGEINVMHADVPDLRVNGPSGEAHSIHVMRGAWVAYSEQGFTGDQYVLEKGQYPGALKWGSGVKKMPQSLRPIRREVCGIVKPMFLLRAYTQTHYAGESREFVGEALDCGVPGLVSFRVNRGSWLLFDEEGCSGNQYILGEGLYPDLTSCGCVSTAIRSLKPIPYSFTDLSISLFSLSGFKGLEETLFSDIDNMFFSQSLRVNSGLWVAYEYSQFNGRQMLLEPGEYSDWKEHSGWDTIGSLKSLRQPKVHIQVRNRALGSVVTTENVSEGSFPAKAFLSPADGSLNTQRWIFTDGLLKNTMRGGCLSVIGSKACVGAIVALWEEHGRMNQRWSLNEDGRISSHLNRSLVLDLKGGNDRDQLILSQLCVNKSTQMWDLDVL
ncbi:beta/gamma crystallin domain-containing protein 3 isoform X2 [Triplophysa dalaica]|uniref:beta/gamma crystallin domain-containing protein 3 isoform X2 n=1 Tax=Triplophysa dalaica TaxID=1582913 RepID=UPI0024E00437|nr:beta/gamma crystallin domain-containing protein 3 isoform X2 [Triplophysa dalaica]